MLKIIKLTPVILLLTLSVAFSQSKEKHVLSKREAVRKSMHVRDSLIRSFNKSDTSINGLIQRLTQYTTTFNQINNNLSEGLDTADVSQNFPTICKRLNKIDSLINTKKSGTLRYLFVLRDNLDHIQDQLEGWQSDLVDVSGKLIQNQNDLIKFKKDTSLKIVPSDSVIREEFFEQRDVLRKLFRKTDSTNRSNLIKVNVLQDKVSVAYTKVLDASDHIDLKIKRFAEKAIAGESSPIWETPIFNGDFAPAYKGTVRLNTILFNLFLKNEKPTHLVGALFALFVCIWVFYTRNRTIKNADNPALVFEQAPFIDKNPFIVFLLISMAIIPYFYDHPPALFLEILFLGSIILSLILVKKYFPAGTFRFFSILFFITVVYAGSNLFIQITNVDRYVILLLSIFSVIIARSYSKKVKAQPEIYPKSTRLIIRLFIALQALSLVLNISGRFSLAKIIGITAAFNLWLLLILYFIIQTIMQLMYLQFQVKRHNNSIINWIDYNAIEKKFRNVFVVLGAIMWTFFLLQNLNIDDWAMDNLTDILGQPHNVANASFTLGGFVIFIAVLWLSSVLSKMISYFYDISLQRQSELSIAKKKNRTSALLIRIAVFSLGFLLAVAASGFPLDKLTIIISAFGVGIGFGLQNIVNNLVSGIILAFEKPIQIGDTVEVDNKSGTMQEIGIRSSKILTADGSEVIIPNGDLISHHVVNWTLSNSNRRIDLTIATTYGTDIEKVKTVLKDLLSKRDDVMKNPGPSVFLNGISESAVEFRVYFWADDIGNVSELKGRVLDNINRVFIEEKIQIPSSRKDVYLHFPEGMPLQTPDVKPAKEDKKKDAQ